MIPSAVHCLHYARDCASHKYTHIHIYLCICIPICIPVSPSVSLYIIYPYIYICVSVSLYIIITVLGMVSSCKIQPTQYLCPGLHLERLFAHIMKFRISRGDHPGFSGSALHPMTGVLQEGVKTDRRRQRLEGRCPKPRMPEPTSSFAARFSLRALEGASPTPRFQIFGHRNREKIHFCCCEPSLGETLL